MNLKEEIESYIGRKLFLHETVHHIDGNSKNNEFSNIYIFNTGNEHISYHNKLMKWAIILNSVDGVDGVRHLRTFPKLSSNIEELNKKYRKAIKKYQLEGNELFQNKVRILRPNEFELLLTGIKKNYQKAIINTMLFTGMRYTELKRLQEYPEWFDGNIINIPLFDYGFSRTQLKRTVRLNAHGIKWTTDFIDLVRKAPSYQTVSENLQRWTKRVKLNPYGITAKTFRKTWTCWLTFFYPNSLLEIMKSQGINQISEIENYKNLPFTRDEQIVMKKYIDGW